MSFGSEIKKAREYKGLSQRKLAKIIGMTQAQLSRIEVGIASRPNKETISKLCQELNLDTKMWMDAFNYSKYEELVKITNPPKFNPKASSIYFMGNEIPINKLKPDDLSAITILLSQYL